MYLVDRAHQTGVTRLLVRDAIYELARAVFITGVRSGWEAFLSRLQRQVLTTAPDTIPVESE